MQYTNKKWNEFLHGVGRTEGYFWLPPKNYRRPHHWKLEYPILNCHLNFLAHDFKVKHVRDFDSGIHVIYHEFELFYNFAYQFRYLWGWFYKARRILLQTESYELYWNLNNLVDKDTGRFLGIDGGGIGRDCGFLSRFREREDLSLADKCETLVYLFVAEMSFAVYYCKAIAYRTSNFEDDFSMNKYHFGYLEKDTSLNIPFVYGFLPQTALDLDNFDINLWENNLFPQIMIEKYVTTKPEWEVFLLFFKFCVFNIKGELRKLLFDFYLLKSKKNTLRWYKPKRYLPENKDDPYCKNRLVNFATCWWRTVYEYGVICVWVIIPTGYTAPRIGFWWTLKMKFKVVYWVFLWKARPKLSPYFKKNAFPWVSIRDKFSEAFVFRVEQFFSNPKFPWV